MHVTVTSPPELSSIPHDDLDRVTVSPDQAGGSIPIFSVCVNPGSEFHTYTVRVTNAEDESEVWLEDAFLAT